MVLLQYQDQSLNISLGELESFALSGDPSPELQQFFETTGQDAATVQEYLNRQVPYGRSPFIPREFGLIVMNKAVGDPLRRESNLDALSEAFGKSVRRDDAFSTLELIENYPESSVRLSLDQLVPVYRDIDLLLTRIGPVLNIAEKLLPEMLCDCDTAEASSTVSAEVAAIAGSAPPSVSRRDVAYGKVSALMKSLWADEAIAASHSTSEHALTLAQAATIPDKNLVIAFGPLQESVSLAELTTFVETGKLPAGWGFYLSIARVNPEDLRAALAQEVSVDFRFLDETLNSLLGEYALYQVGQIVHTRTRLTNIQALRSTLVLSAVEDNKITFLEFLGNYPTPQLYFDGAKLASLGQQIKRLGTAGGAGDGSVALEDWFVGLQATLADQVCTCEAPPENPTNIDPLVVSGDRLSEFLPPDWQPVPAHKEKRGNINVVWLQGTPYEMGYQHGQLLRDEIASLGDTTLGLLRFAGRGLALANVAAGRSFPYAGEECRGMADAAGDIGMTYEACMVLAYGDVYQDAFGYTLPQVLLWEGCSQFVATNEASRDGYLYHGSTVDSGTPIDYIISNPVVFVRQPNGGLPHTFVTYPGVVWPNSGLNVAGITLGLDTALAASTDELSFTGASNVQLMAQVLQGATTFDEVVAYFASQPRVRPNIIMTTDGKSKQAGVMEFTGQHFAVRPLQENGVLYATNHFALPEMYDTQAPPNASSLLRWQRYEQLLEPDGLATLYGEVDPQAMAQILRDRTNPETLTPSPLTVFDDNASPGGNGAHRQATFDPGRRHLWVAAGPPPVPENPFVCFSLEELLNFPDATPCQAPQIN
ncbi:MAG: C45 family autoproteolytic acyltransferase/hydrolase [Elainellaceae cyanobacterium]